MSTTEIKTRIKLKLKYMPIRGSDLEDFGVYSVINCRNTVNVSRIVMINVIFSPLSGGNQKTNKALKINVKLLRKIFFNLITYTNLINSNIKLT